MKVKLRWMGYRSVTLSAWILTAHLAAQRPLSTLGGARVRWASWLRMETWGLTIEQVMNLCCNKNWLLCNNPSRIDAKIMCMNISETVSCFFSLHASWLIWGLARFQWKTQSPWKQTRSLNSLMLPQASMYLAARQGKVLAFNRAVSRTPAVIFDLINSLSHKSLSN